LRDRVTLTGWGNTAPSLTSVVSCTSDNVSEVVCESSNLISRGLGRSYGDCAYLGGGKTVRLMPKDEIQIVDDLATIDAGVSIDELLRVCVPMGLFVPVTPGTRYVTIGGAIAADVHGKNHHRDGTFGAHVQSIELMMSSGHNVMLYPTDDLFWATVGGMGLTGVILRATVRLTKVETSYIRETSRRFLSLDKLMFEMEDVDRTSKYSVAWVDTIAKGRRLGRSVLSIGDHASLVDLPRSLRKDPLRYGSSDGISLPRQAQHFRLTKGIVRKFNDIWYRKPSSGHSCHFSEIPTFFHPLDRVSNWNIIYGRRGFIQYQFVVPDSGAHLVGRIIELLNAGQFPPYFSVLKRFGEQNPGLLSFPMRGWTLAVDIPAQVPGLGRVLDECDSLINGVGGRVYLAKDSRLHPKMFAEMYPRHGEFTALREKYDPMRKFNSNLSRRLGL
jgi:decaprenylphospho-beta-D-ribofuranose 2-oxidase